MDAVVVRVPATVANLGSGFDSIGMALAWHNEVRVERGSGEVSATGPGAETLPTDDTNLVVRAARAVMGDDAALRVSQAIDVPTGRGFGSSAAAVIAGLVGGRALARTDHTDEQLLDIAIGFEGHADNVAPCLLGGVTISTGKTTARIDPSPSIRPLVYVAPSAMRTDAARAALAKDVSRADAVANVGRAALLVVALIQGRSDLLMDATEDRLHQAARFQLMPDSGQLVIDLRSAGVAAFLSGAGPSVAALVDEGSAAGAEKTARDLAPEGWEVRLGSIDPQGARVISENEK